jgi:hypothetical protein
VSRTEANRQFVAGRREAGYVKVSVWLGPNAAANLEHLCALDGKSQAGVIAYALACLTERTISGK